MPNLLKPLQKLLFCILSLVFLANAPALAQETAPAPADVSTIETGQDGPSDQDIDIRIENIFDEIEGLDNVSSSVRSGVVTLRGTVTETTLAERAVQLAGRVKGVVAVVNEIEEITEVSERLVPVIGRFERRLERAYEYLPLLGFSVFVWLVISAFGWFVASRRRPWSWLAPNSFIADLLRQVVFLAFILLGLVLALDILDATAILGTILGAAGIVGLAIGFAVRDTVENYIASILLSVRQPFRPKDYVAIEGFEGHVILLTSRATILMDRDGNHIRIPNATVYKSNIINYSRNPERRFHFQLGIDADSDLQQAMRLCLGELEKLDFVLGEPSPLALIADVGDSNVVLDMSGWINQTQTDFLKARSEAIRLTKIALESNGFALPEPIYRLRLDGGIALGADGGEKRVVAGTGAKATGGGKKPVATSRTEVADTTADTTVLKKVDAEREHGAAKEDLLDRNAADELGPRTQS